MADHVAKRGVDTVSPFLTLQYLYALGRVGRAEAETLLTAIEERAEDETQFDHLVWRDVAVWAAHGIAAHAAEDWDDAIRFLGKALPRMAECGGSHAQRDLFEQIHLDALIKSGQASKAQQVLEMRRTFDPGGLVGKRLTNPTVQLEEVRLQQERFRFYSAGKCWAVTIKDGRDSGGISFPDEASVRSDRGAGGQRARADHYPMRAESFTGLSVDSPPLRSRKNRAGRIEAELMSPIRGDHHVGTRLLFQADDPQLYLLFPKMTRDPSAARSTERHQQGGLHAEVS